MEMDLEKIKQAPSVPTFLEIFRTYYKLGHVVNQLSDFLRERGFNAHAAPALGSEGSFVPIARDAGLGEVGKNGMIITKAYGPRVRLAAIYTDIENLPFADESTRSWVFATLLRHVQRMREALPRRRHLPEPRESPGGRAGLHRPREVRCAIQHHGRLHAVHQALPVHVRALRIHARQMVPSASQGSVPHSRIGEAHVGRFGRRT